MRLLCLIFFTLVLYTAAALDDTAAVRVLKPDASQEAEVFSDPRLKFEVDVKLNKGFFQQLIEFLSEKIFGRSDYETNYSVRKIIIWTIVVLSVALVIWLLSRTELAGLIRPKPKAATFNFTDITGDLNEINFDQQVSESLKRHDFRGAVRWNYLKTLYMLERAGHIAFAPHKTNIDYRMELERGNGKHLIEKFNALSRIYEYVWYGQFVIDAGDYGKFESSFNIFNGQVNA